MLLALLLLHRAKLSRRGQSFLSNLSGSTQRRPHDRFYSWLLVHSYCVQRKTKSWPIFDEYAIFKRKKKRGNDYWVRAGFVRSCVYYDRGVSCQMWKWTRGWFRKFWVKPWQYNILWSVLENGVAPAGWVSKGRQQVGSAPPDTSFRRPQGVNDTEAWLFCSLINLTHWKLRGAGPVPLPWSRPLNLPGSFVSIWPHSDALAAPGPGTHPAPAQK